MTKTFLIIIFFCLMLNIPNVAESNDNRNFHFEQSSENISGTEPSDPNKWDIMGVKLGITSEEAISALKTNIQNVIISQRQSKVASFRPSGIGTFRYPATFGARAEVPGTKDKISIAYDPMSPNKNIIAVKRHIEFAGKANAPSLNSAFNTLIEKYGKYDISQNLNRGYYLSFYWIPSVSKQDRAIIKQNPSQCNDSGIQWFGAEGGPFGDDVILDSVAWSGTEMQTTCGKFFMVYIMQNDDSLVKFMDLLLVDTVAVRNSYDSLGKIVRDGEEANMKKERSHADQVAPKL